MNRKQALDRYAEMVEEFKQQGVYKDERILTTPQGSRIGTTKVEDVINMCANNYLGLCDDSSVIEAAKQSYDKWGFGLASVRFICGTQQVHKDLEHALSTYFGMEDTILYSSCFDANTGLFETILTEEDAIISDALNHASIIDGVRLCKAERYRYKNNDMEDLERCLKEASGARIRLIATDGVFSMDGIIADLQSICDLADKYNAFVMVDDSHAAGFMGKTGRGTIEHCGVEGRVDILTGTLGKALGGASGGFTSARAEIVALLRQHSRPYLFSNTLAPAICGASLEVLKKLSNNTQYRDKLEENTRYFREHIQKVGFDVIDSRHPIVAIMLYDAPLANRVAARLLELGIYVVGFSFPVVPQGKARVRVQVSAAHSKKDLDKAIEAFTLVKEEIDKR